MKMGFMIAGFLVLGGLVGCGSEARDELITRTMKDLNDARDQVRLIKKDIEDELAKSKDKKDLTADQLKAAFELTEELKKKGSFLLERKREIDLAKKKFTEEERQEFTNRYRGQLQQLINELAEEQKALDVALLKAEAINPTAIGELKKKLREAQGNFELVSRQR